MLTVSYLISEFNFGPTEQSKKATAAAGITITSRDGMYIIPKKIVEKTKKKN